MAAAKRSRKGPPADAGGAPAPAASAADTSPRPVTRSCTSAARGAAEAAHEGAVLSALAFLDAGEFRAGEHVRALYRLGPGPAGRPVPRLREKDEPSSVQAGDPVADALGFPSPLLVMNLGDRRGVWQTTPPLVKELGEDPMTHQRAVVVFEQDDLEVVLPAGLKNLGATCYLNSLLQYLFFNVDFRRGLLEAPSTSSVVRALQEVFVLLSRGRRSVVDTASFVAAAGLEAGEQEDATEFSTLLLDWLQRELGQGKGGKGGAGGFIPELFEGETTQILSCMEHPEHTFERREPFFELRARLSPSAGCAAPAAPPAACPKGGPGGARAAPAPPAATVVGDTAAGHQADAGAPAAAAVSKNRPAGPGGKRPSGGKRKAAAPPPVVHLEQLLADTAFPDEMLDGANQYHCPKCDRKVDARKSLRLARPPPYLHVTVERYHYDLKKGEREKLLNPVSFPQRLQLRASGGAREAAAQTSTYECIGYLEHVSDSAHSGHYTATLYQEEEDVAEALALVRPAAQAGAPEPDEAAARAAPEAGAAGAAAAEPPPKRPRCCDADAAAGSPRRGVWWTLDDMSATRVEWPEPRAAEGAAAGGCAGPGEPAHAPAAPRGAPARIESSSAYLILYRRSGLTRRGHPEVPASLAEHSDAANAAFAQEQRAFEARSAAVAAFVGERREATAALARALRQEAEPAGSSPQQLSLVPSAWLEAFLHGQDVRVADLLAGGTVQPLAPVLYGPALLRGPGGEGFAVDPLAVWTGEVKLVPTSALEAVGGRGGLDPSLFFTADECALGPPACEKVWRLARLFAEEWVQTGKLLSEGRVGVAEARALQAAGRGSEAVWVSLRVQKLWQKAMGTGSAKGQPWQVAVMRALLTEARSARWAGAAEAAEGEEPPAEAQEEPGRAGAAAASQAAGRAPAASAQVRVVQRCEVNLTAGLLCPHGLVCRPKAGFLCKRGELEQLLEAAGAKERAYRELWPDARAVPRLRTGVPGGGLLGFGDTCPDCRGDCADQAGVGAAPTPARRRLVVRRRYPSGVRRKAGNLAIPEGDGPVTGACLRGLLKDQMSLPVAKLLVVRGGDADGAEVELQDSEVLAEGVDHIVVEKDEGVQPAVEAAAFQGSVFRGPAARGAAA